MPDSAHFQRVTIELPPPYTKRWTARRKAAVVQSVRLGLISLEEACLRYDLTVEELFGWQRAVDRHGSALSFELLRGFRGTLLEAFSGLPNC